MVDKERIVVLHTAVGGDMLDISDNRLEITGIRQIRQGSALALNLSEHLPLITTLYWLVVQAESELTSALATPADLSALLTVRCAHYALSSTPIYALL